jgi:hypothetical protein
MKTEELNGTAGQLIWKLRNSIFGGTLTISGKGNMPNFDNHNKAQWAKYDDVINTVIIETGVTSIGEQAFIDCYCLKSITIPNSVTSIGKMAFLNCTSLTSITIPKSVTNIESWAFGCCHNFTSITNLNSVPIGISPDVFPTVRKGKLFIPIISYNSGEQIFNTKEVEYTLKVPKASISAYKNAEMWKEFNIVGIEEDNE